MVKGKLGQYVKYDAVYVAGEIVIPAGEGKIVQQHVLPTQMGQAPEVVDVVHSKNNKNVEVFDKSIQLINSEEESN